MIKKLNLIKNLIKHRDRSFGKKIDRIHPYDIAQIFEKLSENERFFLYHHLTPRQLAAVLSYLDSADTGDYLKEIGADKSIAVLEEMSTDDITDILNEIDDDEFRSIITKFNAASQKELAYLRNYREDQVGAVMTTDYIAVENNIDVKEAMKILIREANDSETIDPLYVTDNGNLVGVLKLVNLIMARSPKTIDNLADKKIIFVNVGDAAADAVTKMNNYGLSVLPVVDCGKMVGIVTIDDAIDIMAKEETETYGQLAAVAVDEKNIFKNMLNRAPWLLILLVFGFLVSSVINIYEETLRRVTALVLFQTLILDMVGNLSTQSLAVSIRHLVRDDLKSGRNILKHLYKEFKISFINSLICGIMALGAAFLLLYWRQTDNAFTIALVVALAVLASQLIGGLMGTLIPILFAKIKINPALASGPLITTLNDIIAVVIYFNLAAALLNIL